jgi:hypothetical protein
MGFQFQSLAAASPVLVPDLGLGYADLGTLIGLYFLPGIVIALPGGALGRRFGDRNVVALGLVLMALGGLLSCLADGFALLAAGRLIAGIGALCLIFVIMLVLTRSVVAAAVIDVDDLKVHAAACDCGNEPVVGGHHDGLLVVAGHHDRQEPAGSSLGSWSLRPLTRQNVGVGIGGGGFHRVVLSGAVSSAAVCPVLRAAWVVCVPTSRKSCSRKSGRLRLITPTPAGRSAEREAKSSSRTSTTASGPEARKRRHSSRSGSCQAVTCPWA